MNCQYVRSKLQDIDNALWQVSACAFDPALGSMLDSYLVVFISGIYEDCVERLFVERASRSRDPELQRFVQNVVGNMFRNPEYGKIKGLLKYLDPSYGNKLDLAVPQPSRDAIDSIVANKNNVAHGSTSNATLRDLIGYHQKAKRVFQALDRMLT